MARTQTGTTHDARWRTLSLLVLLAAWQFAGMLVQDPVLPSALDVGLRLWEQLVHDSLLYHLGVTLARVGTAFIIAMAIGTALGILLGRSRRFDVLFDGLLVLGLNIPALVTIILCFIWFGLTEVAAITAVAVNKIPTVVVTVREGARAVDRRLLNVADAFRLPPLHKLTRVYLPQLYPYLMAAARSGLALIWKIVLVVELLGRSNGVGFQLGTYFQFFDITGILAYTLAFAGVVLLIEALLVRPLETRLTRWRA